MNTNMLPIGQRICNIATVSTICAVGSFLTAKVTDIAIAILAKSYGYQVFAIINNLMQAKSILLLSTSAFTGISIACFAFTIFIVIKHGNVKFSSWLHNK